MTPTVWRITSSCRAIAALGAAAASAAFASDRDASWKDIQFGAFASQGYLHSSANDYLGKTSDGTFDFREYGVNASWAAGAWRLGAQVFGQKLGDYGKDDLKLDWATVDYQPKQWLGFRAGRVKMPRGLYNEALDIDAVRPFVLLPQGVYDARLRDFNAAFNGGMLFGNVELGRAGSVDYRLFYGDIPISTRSGASDYFNNDVPFPNLQIGMDAVRGGSLFWNTPVSGLRAGYSYSAFDTLSSLRDVAMGPGMPALVMFKTADIYERHLFSVEFIKGDWTFAAESGTEHGIYFVGFPGTVPPVAMLDFNARYHYVSAARRVNRWLELGAYYSYSRDTEDIFPANPALFLPALRQKDYAISARFDLHERVIFKLEAHYMDGAGKLFDTATNPQPFQQRDNSWTLFAAKFTVTY